MSSADEDQLIGMGWIWAGTFAIVAVFGLGVTPWETIKELILSLGVSDQGKQLLFFVAGYTLPLTVGFGVIAFLGIHGVHRGVPGVVTAAGVALILWLAGETARSLGMGSLLPDYRGGLKPDFTEPGVRHLEIVLTAYFNTYGWGLMLSALAIGCAAAIHVDRWLYNSTHSNG